MERNPQEREGHCISGYREHRSQSTGIHDYGNAATVRRLQHRGRPTKGLSVTNRESKEKRIPERLCSSHISDSLGGQPRGAVVELTLATGQRFTTTGSTQIFMRTRDGVNVSGDFQTDPKTTGL